MNRFAKSAYPTIRSLCAVPGICKWQVIFLQQRMPSRISCRNIDWEAGSDAMRAILD